MLLCSAQTIPSKVKMKSKTEEEVELPRKKGGSTQLLEIRHAHWGIETGLHYRRDVTLKEDTARMTVGNTGIIIAMAGTLLDVLITRKPLTRIISAKSSAASSSSSMINTVF